MKRVLIGLVLCGGLFGMDYGAHRTPKRTIVVLKNLVPNVEGIWVTVLDHGLVAGDQVTFTFRVTLLLQSGKYRTLTQSMPFTPRVPMTVWFPVAGVEKVASVNVKEEQDYTIE
jgi:hypothetical protein